MSSLATSDSIILRPATQADARAIRQMIIQVRDNPLGLSWQRFILAIDTTGKVIGCGQVKQHYDGSFELASIAVLPDWRGRGIASKIIRHLTWQHPGVLYLTCRSTLGEMYRKFGFRELQLNEMPPYFRRLSRLVSTFNRLLLRPATMLVMRRG